jgi:hypothetical protein
LARVQAQCEELLNWMLRNLSERTLPPGLVDFTAAEVASYRAQRLTDVAGARAKLRAATAAQQRCQGGDARRARRRSANLRSQFLDAAPARR